MKRFMITAALLCAATSISAQAQESHQHNHVRPDSHAPIGVMGDHTHKEGEWMASYRYATMHMDGNRDGTSDISNAEVLSNFMVTPTEMQMEMHMFGLMYGVSDRFTAMAMLPYIRKSMDHVTRSGAVFETESKGLGDIKLTGLYTIYERGPHHWHINAGISLPTGEIDERDDTPAGNIRLPYPMQLGSGTYDLLPGVTYTALYDHWSWGSQANAVMRLGENDNDYRLGHEYQLSLWGAHQLTEYASVSLRLDGRRWGDITGADPQLNPMMVPTARTDLRGGERIDALAGINVVIPGLEDNRLALEFGTPVYQRLDGPQLETDYRLVAGWQLTF